MTVLIQRIFTFAIAFLGALQAGQAADLTYSVERLAPPSAWGANLFKIGSHCMNANGDVVYITEQRLYLWKAGAEQAQPVFIVSPGDLSDPMISDDGTIYAIKRERIANDIPRLFFEERIYLVRIDGQSISETLLRANDRGQASFYRPAGFSDAMQVVTNTSRESEVGFDTLSFSIYNRFWEETRINAPILTPEELAARHWIWVNGMTPDGKVFGTYPVREAEAGGGAILQRFWWDGDYHAFGPEFDSSFHSPNNAPTSTWTMDSEGRIAGYGFHFTPKELRTDGNTEEDLFETFDPVLHIESGPIGRGRVFVINDRNEFLTSHAFRSDGTFTPVRDLLPEGYETVEFGVMTGTWLNENGQILLQDLTWPKSVLYRLTPEGNKVNTMKDLEAADPLAETIDVDPDEPGNQISLRAAIQVANAKPDEYSKENPAVIEFDIPGDGIPTITLTKPLPVIEVPTKIDGASQAAGEVELRGGGLNAAGLNLQAGNSEVRGLIIHEFTGPLATGIRISGDGENVIAGNKIGVDATGDIVQGLSHGILINSSTDNVLGGANPLDANILHGENYSIGIQGEGSNGNRIIGNRIGIGANGEGLVSQNAATKFGTGILITQGDRTEIGGPGALGNFIAGDYGILIGNGDFGVQDTRIQGNRIGLNEPGTTVVGGEIGVGMLGAETLVSGTRIFDNDIAGHAVIDVWCAGWGIRDTTIERNTIGLKFDGSGGRPTGLPMPTFYGIRMDAGQRHTIKDNVIAGQDWNVLLGGDLMFEFETVVDADNDGVPESGGLQLYSPLDNPGGDPDGLPSRGSLVEGNTLGLNAKNEVPDGVLQISGLAVFGDTSETTFTNNTIAGHKRASLWLQEGTVLNVSHNRIGTVEGEGHGNNDGIFIEEASLSTIGPGNVIARNEGSGLLISGPAASIRVFENSIGTNSFGLVSWPNTHGVSLLESEDDSAEDILLERNVISGNTETGVLVDFHGNVSLRNNRIGNSALPNGNGVSVVDGIVEIVGNTISHNTLGAIVVTDDSDSHVEVRSGPVFENGDGLGPTGISYKTPPFPAPNKVVALRTAPDENGKVTVVFGVPAVGKVTLPGEFPIAREMVTIEIYGNRGPGDTQGRVPLLRKTVDATKPLIEKLVVGNDSALATMSTFTVTLTRRGRTSEFSTHAMSEAFVWPEVDFGESDPNKVTLTWPESDLFIVETASDAFPGWRDVMVETQKVDGMTTATFPVRDDVGSEIFRLKLDLDAVFSR